MTFQNNILKYSKLKGLTLSELSRLSGVPQPTIHGWSTGRLVHNLDHLRKVCLILEISLYELYFGIPDPFSVKFLGTDIFSGEVHITVHKIIKSEVPPFIGDQS